MSQSAPWSVKGVDPETRETAKVLAQRSGMTLGQWLDTLISRQDMPEKPLFHGIDRNHSPLAAIARRLETAEKGYHGKDLAVRRDEAAAGVSAAVLARHIRASETRMAELIERLIRRQEESEAHVAALVDALVDGFAVRQTGPAAPSPGHHGAPSSPDGSVEDLERRLAAMAAELDAAPSQPEVEPRLTDALSEQIASLTREIAELRRTNADAGAGKQDLADLRADIASLGRHLTGMVTPDQFVQIDRKLDLLARQAHDPSVLASIQRETSDIRTRLGDIARQAEPSQRLEQKLDALQLAVEDGQAAAGASLSALSARLDALDARGSDDAALSALERQIAEMARAVEALAGARPDFTGLEPALKAALAQSPLQNLPEELQRHYRDLRSLQDGGGQTHKALDALQTLLHQVSGRLAAVEDVVRTRSTGALVSGPPEVGDTPPMFGRERPDDIVWSPELPRSLAGDAPLHSPAEEEPLDGRPSQVSALGRGGPATTSTTRSAFIAAARRAARAAAEAEGSLAEETAKPEGSHEPFYKRHKRPILLGLAAVTMMMAALQGGKIPSAPGSARQLTRTAPAGPLSERRFDPGGNGTQAKGGAAASLSEASPPVRAERASSPASAPQTSPPNEAVSLFEEARQLDTPHATTFDLAKAAGLYRQAAQLGYAPALFLLGLAYDKGRGVGHDAMLAGLWYQRAAEHGSAKAMYNLAVLYAGGAVMGVPDYEQAARWFHQAAEQGHTASQYNFALLAAQGLGTPRDLAASYRFLAQAAAKGDLDALARLNEIEQRMTPEEKARAKG
ncbi:hypothetical protein LMIY3S_03764 [Labrys miyagiensis]